MHALARQVFWTGSSSLLYHHYSHPFEIRSIIILVEIAFYLPLNCIFLAISADSSVVAFECRSQNRLIQIVTNVKY